MLRFKTGRLAAVKVNRPGINERTERTCLLTCKRDDEDSSDGVSGFRGMNECGHSILSLEDRNIQWSGAMALFSFRVPVEA